MSIRVVVAEDYSIIREGLIALLERQGFSVVGEAADGHQAVELVRTHRPDVAVLDLSMPLLNGIDAAVEILKSVPCTRPLLLTMHDEDHYVLEALRAGVKGYVLKSQAATELVQAIREVCRGSTYVSPRICHTVVNAYVDRVEAPADPLSSRERRVVQLIAEGKTTKEVACLLEISVKTAETHRTRLMQKLNIHETASLVRYAIRRGLVQAVLLLTMTQQLDIWDLPF